MAIRLSGNKVSMGLEHPVNIKTAKQKIKRIIQIYQKPSQSAPHLNKSNDRIIFIKQLIIHLHQVYPLEVPVPLVHLHGPL